MKKLVTLFFAIVLTCISGASANKEETKDDAIAISHSSESNYTTEEEPSDNSQILYNGDSYGFIFNWKKKKYLSPHWTGLGFSFLNYKNKDIPYSGLKNSMSYTVSINAWDVSTNIGNSNWLIYSGMGFDWSRYHFDDNAALTKVDGITVFEPAPDDIHYKSSKLLAYYVTVPLMLEFQVNHDFYISGGVIGYLKYYSKSQVKYYTEGGKKIQNKGRDLNMRPVDLKFRLQLGFQDFAVFANLSPFSMFPKDKGPDIKPYAIGIIVDI